MPTHSQRNDDGSWTHYTQEEWDEKTSRDNQAFFFLVAVGVGPVAGMAAVFVMHGDVDIRQPNFGDWFLGVSVCIIAWWLEVRLIRFVKRKLFGAGS